jgi:hypothetical protein
LAAIKATFGGAVAFALTIVFATRLVSASVSRLYTEKGATWVTVLVVAILLDAVAQEAQHAWRAATDDFDRGKTNAPIGSTGHGTEDFASFNNWKRSVEQTLKDAKASEEARKQDGGEGQESVDETKAPEKTAQAATEGDRQTETLTASDENDDAGAKAASAAIATQANAANDAKRATESKGSGPFSDSTLTADAQEEQPGSGGRFGWQSRSTEFHRPIRETDAEVAHKDAVARHALTYSWVTTDRDGHRWVHIRSLRYRR